MLQHLAREIGPTGEHNSIEPLSLRPELADPLPRFSAAPLPIKYTSHAPSLWWLSIFLLLTDLFNIFYHSQVLLSAS